jgi:tRNA A-37 threonylcarbamoyl transferase component Bud32
MESYESSSSDEEERPVLP